MTDLWEDYKAFHSAQIASLDMDPIYPVLKYVAADRDPESRMWLSFLHVSYYHIGSALKAWEAYPSPTVITDEAILNLPKNTERRNHRVPGRLDRHLRSLLEQANAHGGFDAWMNGSVTADPVESWNRIEEELLKPWGNGRWASFKTAEILQKVHDYPIQAPNMAHAHSSGPRKGLELLFPDAPKGNSPADVATLDRMSDEVLDRLAAEGVWASMETAETSLCDFHSMVKGRYYVGHDTDAMLVSLSEVPSGLSALAMEARRATLPNEYLAEIGGWDPRDHSRNALYRDTKQVALR